MVGIGANKASGQSGEVLMGSYHFLPRLYPSYPPPSPLLLCPLFRFPTRVLAIHLTNSDDLNSLTVLSVIYGEN